MSILALLKRMDDALLDARRTGRQIGVTVGYRDLQELLYHFRGMDAQDRLHYPVHVKMMADAAQRALPHLQGTYAVEVERALDISRPNWRNEPL